MCFGVMTGEAWCGVFWSDDWKPGVVCVVQCVLE